MNTNPFYRLSPFIQEFIYSHNWTELREIQVEACKVIFDTDAHLLLASGTASGKTEAAFLPILTQIYDNPPSSLGVIYIGPTKALINDQFVRLNDLLKEAYIPVWHWHGDVSQTQKTRLLKKPEGILQITPESVESLLINKNTELTKLFFDLRFIIIDEVHVFMNSDRGRQILCQMERLSRFFKNPPRRIGLSATLADYLFAENWLKSGTSRVVITPKVSGSGRKILLSAEHFFLPQEETPSEENSKILSIENNENNSKITSSRYDSFYKYIYDNSKPDEHLKKCLIFTNSRGESERVISSLRQIAETENFTDIYYVHHGSISAFLREEAESSMREPLKPAVTAATITLELGIDIGELDRVIQINSPFSVASFLQRLGRSGRRGKPANMAIVCREDAISKDTILPEQFPWQLLQAIAIIQLYLEEKWIEPHKPVKYPFSLLYHQTMSTLASTGELSPSALAERILTLTPFNNISQDDYKELLLHLIKIDQIQKMEDRGLIIGLAGEKIVNNFKFYSVFPDTDEFSVRADSEQIGSISYPPPIGERFALAGRTWEVLEVDLKSKAISVKLVKGKSRISWSGMIGDIHTKILQRMKKVLFEETEYKYLQKHARERLFEARRLAQSIGLQNNNIFSLGGNVYCIFPWMGTIPFQTLNNYLKKFCGYLNISKRMSPYYIVFEVKNDKIIILYNEILSISHKQFSEYELVCDTDFLQKQKYDEYIPDNLLRKTFSADYLDVNELKDIVKEWKTKYRYEKK